MQMIKKFILSILCISMSITLLHPMQIMAQENNNMDEEVILDLPEAVILNEDESERTIHSKDFIMSDKSTQTIIYSVPVHYEEDGEWKEIDNTLIDDKLDETAVIYDEEYDEVIGYETKESKLKMKFSKKMHKKNLANIKYDDYKITWGFDGFDNKSDATILSKEENEDPKLKIYDNISQSVLYEDIKENVSLQYSIDSLKIKEDIIIEDKTDINAFTFNYKIKNLELVLNDGDIEARDIDTDDVIFIMPKPYMVDAEGNFSEEVTYTLTQINDKKYTITVTADSEWINDEERAYPIIIDPAITTKRDSNYFDTTFITKNQPTLNHTDKTELLVGNESSEYHACRTLIKFTLPAMNRGDMIVDARMALYSYSPSYYSTAADLQINAHMITNSWDYEDVTWNTSPSYESMVLDYDHVRKSDSSLGAMKTFDITNAVKRWYDGTANNGILLKSNVESTDWTNYGFKAKFANERFTSNQNYYPFIQLTFRNNKGIESYWDYTSVMSHSKDQVSIDNYSGNLIIEHTDLSTTGSLLPVSVGHVFNSFQIMNNVSNIKPYVGKGWKLSIQQTLLPSSKYGLSGEDADNYPYVYMDEDGTLHYFKAIIENGTMTELVDEDGLGLTLTKNDNSTSERYVIKDKDKNTMTFNTEGCLTKIKDQYGNSIELTYDGTTIKSIKDGSGHLITLNTDSSGYLTSMSDSASNTTTFAYDSNRNLTSISNPDGMKSTYSYTKTTNDAQLDKITSQDQTSLSFGYSSLSSGKRVITLYESGSDGTLGQTIRFDRSEYNITDIITSGIDNTIDTADDITTRLEFDDFGRLITRSSSNYKGDLAAEKISMTNAVPQEDNSDIKKLNRITKLASLAPTVNNLLKNHSGESTSSWTSSSSIDTSSFTFASTNDEYLFGKKSFKLNATSCTQSGRSRFYQDIDTNYIKANTTYTASAYIKTNNIVETSGQENGGAAILIYMNAPSIPTTDDPEAADVVGEYIIGTTDEAVNNGWRRVSVTFTTPSDVNYVRFSGIIRGATGTAYFDGLQLEEANVPGFYNMIENGSFERVSGTQPESWSGRNLTSDKISTSVRKYGNKGYKFEPNADKTKELVQEIEIDGKESDVYMISGWAYGKGVKSTDDGRKLMISVKITYSDLSTKWPSAAIFNDSLAGWKYSATAFNLSDGTSAEKIPTKLTIYIRSHGQANGIYYDGIQLNKRDFTIATYDDNGNMVKLDKTNYTYDSEDRITKQNDGMGNILNYTYNSYGDVTSITNSGNNVKESYIYDNKGNLTIETISNTQSDVGTIKNETIYDETKAYVIKKLDADKYETSFDINTQSGMLNSITDAKNNTISYGYDDKDRLTSVSRGSVTNTISYDSKGRLSAVSVPSTSYRYTYDVFSNQSKIKDVEHTSITYQNNNGNTDTVTLANGLNTSYTYNEYSQILGIRENDTLIQRYEYDKEGNIYQIYDYKKDIRIKYDRDLEGNIIRVGAYDLNKHGLKDKWLYGKEYGYDTFSRQTKENTKIGNTTNPQAITYKIGNYVSSYTLDSTKKISYGYDALNRTTSKSINTSSPISISYSYAVSKIGSTYTTNKLEKEVIGGIEYTYTYDKVGNITSITRKDGSETKKVNYHYDEHSQLIREDNQFLNKSLTYTYGISGNIKTKKEFAYATGTLGSSTKTITYSYSNTNWYDELTSYNGQSIIYDEIGNPTSYKGNVLTWNGRELTSLTNTSQSITYTYGSDGLRRSKNVNGTTTTYDYLDGILIRETGPNGTLVYTNDNTGNLAKISHTKNSTTNHYYVTTNSRGDVEGIYNSSGTLQCRYIYDSWGNTIKIVDANNNEITNTSHIGHINPIRYRGYYYDKETKLYYLNSRYYDPETMRFINADDISVVSLDPSSLYDKKIYSYCDNNPVSRKDSNGHLWWEVVAIGAITGLIGQFISDIITSFFSGELYLSSWQSYAGAAVGGAFGSVALVHTGNAKFANFTNGFFSELSTQTLESFDSNAETKSNKDILEQSLVAGAISYQFTDFDAVNKITGKPYKSKFENEFIKNSRGFIEKIGYSISKNAIKVNVVNDFFQNIVNGIKNILR